GSPSAPNGACSVTAGKPCEQRAATRRNGRAGRPSCQDTTRVSSTRSWYRRPFRSPDALDDEKMLALSDEPEAPRLPDDVVALARVHQLLGQLGVVALES